MKSIGNKNRTIIGQSYERVRHEIFTIFRQVGIDITTCEDLVQDVFVKIMALDIIIEDQLKGLAVTIAYQKRIDYLRRRFYIKKANADLAWLMERSYTHSESEINDILQVELKAINNMSDMDCTIYKMIRFEEKTADEIVLTTGLSKRAIESRIYRTRNLVRNAVRQAIGF